MRLDRLVALKVVRAELLGDPEARLRFRREAQIVARLQHPSIVAIFDYGTFADGGAFIVMELVRGEDLRQRAAARRTARAGARDADPGDGLRGDRGGAPRGRAAPRSEAGEHPAAGRRRAEAKVLDFGVAKVVTDDAHEHDERSADARDADDGAGTDRRHAGLHGARAVQRRGRRTPRTDVFSLGRDRLRDAVGRAAVRPRHR